jgi:hypothetical protein
MMIMRNATAAVLLTCACALQAGAQAPHKAPPKAAQKASSTDPWSRVPAAPASCFSDDDYTETLDKARLAVVADIEKQEEVNRKAREQFEKMDGMEKSRRMQAFMMKNPQEAMKVMQANQAAGTDIRSSVLDAAEEAKRLDPEFDRLTKDFADAVETAIRPIQAKIKHFIDTRTNPAEGGYTRTTPADRAALNALIDEQNASYEKVCARYLGANGSLVAWLKEYKEKVTIPTRAATETNDAAIVMQMKMMDAEGSGYRSTGTLEAVRDHLRSMERVYRLRKPRTMHN